MNEQAINKEQFATYMILNRQRRIARRLGKPVADDLITKKISTHIKEWAALLNHARAGLERET